MLQIWPELKVYFNFSKQFVHHWLIHIQAAFLNCALLCSPSCCSPACLSGLDSNSRAGCHQAGLLESNSFGSLCRTSHCGHTGRSNLEGRSRIILRADLANLFLLCQAPSLEIEPEQQHMLDDYSDHLERIGTITPYCSL